MIYYIEEGEALILCNSDNVPDNVLIFRETDYLKKRLALAEKALNSIVDHVELSNSDNKLVYDWQQLTSNSAS